MPTLQNLKTKEARAKLERDVDKFLEAGGQVHQVQPEDCRWYKDQQKKPGPRKGRTNGLPMVINPQSNAKRLEAYQRRQKVGFPGVSRQELTPDHPWHGDVLNPEKAT